MEISSFRGCSGMEMRDPNFKHQWQMNSLEELRTLPTAFGDNFQPSFSHSIPKTCIETTSHTGIDRPSKLPKTDSWNVCHQSQTHHFSNLQATFPVSLTNTTHPNEVCVMKPTDERVPVSPNSVSFPSDVLTPRESCGNQNYGFEPCQGDRRIITATRHSQTQDHVMAERKRRAKLSQQFIALSALVPGLKKMDKASVLGDAIKYLKQLQEHVKALEEQTSRKTMESIVVKKAQVMANGDNFPSEESFLDNPIGEPLLEIEARFSNKDVLIRIYCEKTKGVVEKIMSKMEELHLTVINSSIMTFGTSALDVTVIAQMKMEFSMTLKDLARNLHTALKMFM